MSENVIGIIEEVIDNGKGKGSGIRVGGAKYGVYDPTASGMGDVAVGDNVSFRFSTKDGSGGIVYKNLQGRITKTAAGASPTAVAPPAASGGGSSRGRGGFPIGLEDGQRSIIRQNALTNARELYVGTGGDMTPRTTSLIIDLAREFEAYTTGDIERFAAEEALAAVEAGFEVE